MGCPWVTHAWPMRHRSVVRGCPWVTIVGRSWVTHGSPVYGALITRFSALPPHRPYMGRPSVTQESPLRAPMGYAWDTCGSSVGRLGYHANRPRVGDRLSVGHPYHSPWITPWIRVDIY